MTNEQAIKIAIQFQHLIGLPIGEGVPGYVIDSISPQSFKLIDGTIYHTVIYKSNYLTLSSGDLFWGFLHEYCNRNNIQFPKVDN